MWLYHRVMSPNDADGMANSVDPDQTAPSLIWVCTVCPGISVRKLRIITVLYFSIAIYEKQQYAALQKNITMKKKQKLKTLRK